MEAQVPDSSRSFSGDNPILDPDLYDTYSFDVPDPGLLVEKNELSFTELPQVLPLFTGSQQWQGKSPSARAHQLWLLLRGRLHDIVEKEKTAELHVACLTHGLEPLRRLEVAAGLRSVAQDPAGGRFVVLDGAGHLHLHREDGWAQEKLPAPVALTGLVAVLGPLGALGRFVGWGPVGLAILGPSFNLLWLSQLGVGGAPGCEPTCCLPAPDWGLLVVAHVSGSLALWKFRSGGRRLVLRGPPLQPPSPAGQLKRLALGPAPPYEARCCFAACGSAVLTFNLQVWALVDVRRDLHKTTISDLAYCEEVEAMVTASRDSTVKVWEADWQIRMVFVGHTGPVTALAVLPNTTLALSASQDGTLRTWDLRAAAQVGEVGLCYWGQDARSGRVRHLLAPVGPGWPVLSVCTNSVELWRVRELYSPLAHLPAPVLHLQVAPTLPAPTHPSLPTRLVCACADGSVYLVSAATGRTVSALLLGPEDCAAAVAYCLPCEALWLLTQAGHLVRANAALNPMLVLHRVQPPPPQAPWPCCLHLYSHLTDPGSAFASWELVRQNRGEPRRSTVAWKNKNRFLPVVGHTDGTLSVLEWFSSETVFHTKAHSPGPVTAIASTWNSVVSSGGDLTVKMWRVFPYAEESLNLLRTFSCCHLVMTLCALGKRVTVGFEDPDSATYGLVQFGPGDNQRFDHRPQDDPTDHITGLCCCPTLKLYACSSLDCTVRIWTAKNRLLRLLQLNSAPQALTFCSNSGDLVLALGSHLCLVSHGLYLPTSYLVKKLCWKAPDMVDDPPLPLTSQQSLTSAQLQRLASLHGAASLRSSGRPLGHQGDLPSPSTRFPSRPHPSLCPDWLVCHPVSYLCLSPSAVLPCLSSIARWSLLSNQWRRRWVGPPYMLQSSRKTRLTSDPPPQDLEALVARDQDLQQLRVGLVVPADRPPPSWQQRQEAFDNYLHLIYGTSLLGVRSGKESWQWNTGNLTVEREIWNMCALPRAAPCLWQAVVNTEAQTVPTALPPQDLGTLGQRYARPPQVTLPIPPTHRRVHSRASLLLARSSLCHDLGLSLDLQLQWEQLQGWTTMVQTPPSSHLRHRVPLLLKRRPKEPLSNVGGFFPATAQSHKYPLPISFPGCVPNSVVLQQIWLPREVSCPSSLAWLTPQKRHKARRSGWVAGQGSGRALLSPAQQITYLYSSLQPSTSQDDLWLQRHNRQFHTQWQRELTLWFGEEEGEEENLDLEDDWTSAFPKVSDQQLKPQQLVPGEGSADLTLEPSHSPEAARWKYYGSASWEEYFGHLPRFLHFFVCQDWFKRLFPNFSLEAYPEMARVEGLVSALLDLLKEATWADRVYILHALLRLLPDVSSTLHGQLQSTVLYLLNLDQPPSFQDQTQKQFVTLALQLLLACSLESRDVVLELMTYYLYSPAPCRPEIKKLLDGLGLWDPEGFLFKELLTWVQGSNFESKAALRRRCCQKLEDLIQKLQVGLAGVRWATSGKPLAVLEAFLRSSGESQVRLGAPCLVQLWVQDPHLNASLASPLGWGLGSGAFSVHSGAPGTRALLPLQVNTVRAPSIAQLSTVLSRVSNDTLVALSASKETAALQALMFSRPLAGTSLTPSATSWSPSTISERLSHALEVPVLVFPPAEPDPTTLQRHTQRKLSDMLQTFPAVPQTRAGSSVSSVLPDQLLPLEKTDWSRSQMLDLGLIDMLNLFCAHQRARQQSLAQETALPRPPGPNTVLLPPRAHWRHPILRLQEVKKVPGSRMRLRGRMLSRLCAGRALDGSIRMLKLPLPRVELQPFPPGWPRPARSRPPLLLQPALQRYFLLDDTDPDSYR
ncbi:LOW QUALITY PROTEIN: WD repeat-containing protein 97 [Nycticebus coucang]|uniref:LOW QUALITY PROTEIN: WD repeat-containing protein 97 n=1 Tax=Nycticebus coucang TaxID=9470 RepID=UPI00234C4B54|nr:LOW QUALITY PROTEIN: WD repeat-containing protein 97 [Nycticebus coucang]